jgi:ectoine hydroxylase-related dioxygenase (phytanoyl-CoA dioxygenase family)
MMAKLALAEAAASPASAAEILADQGYCMLPELVPSGQIEALSAELDDRFAATPFCEGMFSGSRTKRFHSLLTRSAGAASLVLNDTILAAVEDILLPFADTIQLNLTQAIEIHPGQVCQIPHRDQNMWGGDKGRMEYLVNVMWPLTPFTRQNGATRIWPGSHRRQDELSLPEERAVTTELMPGDALLFLGSTLHGAGANNSPAPRRGIIISYSLGWLKPYENMSLTYPPAVAKAFPKRLQELTGYCRHRPNLGNYDGNCPSLLLADAVPDHQATSDLLLPGQNQKLQEHLERQAYAPLQPGKSFNPPTLVEVIS